MKTAVSIPDEVFEEVERLAADLKTSRSQLYSRALREFVARHASNHVTDAMNQVIAEVGEGSARSEDFSRIAARRLLERVDW
jgi:metal-responsive CopG/Arc/MetJ family transcriptional regulator